MSFKGRLNCFKELLPNIRAVFLQYILTVYAVNVRKHVHKKDFFTCKDLLDGINLEGVGMFRRFFIFQASTCGFIKCHVHNGDKGFFRSQATRIKHLHIRTCHQLHIFIRIIGVYSYFRIKTIPNHFAFHCI